MHVCTRERVRKGECSWSEFPVKERDEVIASKWARTPGLKLKGARDTRSVKLRYWRKSEGKEGKKPRLGSFHTVYPWMVSRWWPHRLKILEYPEFDNTDAEEEAKQKGGKAKVNTGNEGLDNDDDTKMSELSD